MESDWPSKADDYQLNYPIGQGACGLVRQDLIISNFIPLVLIIIAN